MLIFVKNKLIDDNLWKAIVLFTPVGSVAIIQMTHYHNNWQHESNRLIICSLSISARIGANLGPFSRPISAA